MSAGSRTSEVTSVNGGQKMMNPDSASGAEIARYLSRLWGVYQAKTLAQYVQEQFGRATSNPTVDGISIAECCDGNFDSGYLSGDLAKTWLIDSNGLTATDQITPPDEGIGDYYRLPMIRFFSEDNRIVIGETLGPTLVSRKRAFIGRKSSEIQIHSVETLWTYDSLCIEQLPEAWLAASPLKKRDQSATE